MNYLPIEPMLDMKITMATQHLLIIWIGIIGFNICMGMEFVTLDHIRTQTNPEIQKEAVDGLIQRLISNRSNEFSIKIDPSIGPKNRDTFQIKTQNDEICITGTTGVAAAWGFYYYLTQYCGAHISWAGVQVALPTQLPVITQTLTVTSNDRFRYYQNVCTVSYSFVWWTWERWEQEIDWMAMNGINLPLAFNGQEAIWQRVYMAMNFTQQELDEHFGGPAFLAWSRMANMHGWGGPLSKAWHQQQLALQHKILDRMRSLGLTPVLPAFSGHVPLSITKHYPNVSISHSGDWGHFNSTYCCTAFLDVNDPLFGQIGKAFIKEYTAEFGTDHIYNTDSFNEVNPKSSAPEYLHNASKAVYDSMIEADPHAIWLMQGWLFQNSFWKQPQVKALLTGVPQGKMIVLDLFSEVFPLYMSTQSYYGQPFIWCMLHNFGGTIAMYGVVDRVNEGPFEGRSFTNSSMVGIGLTPEGINQNNVIYEYMMENSWRKHPRDTIAWAADYSRRRYGKENQNTEKAWGIFMCGIYNATIPYRDHSSDVYLVLQPALLPTSRQVVWYNIEEFMTGWDMMVTESDGFSHSTLYRYDLVDVSRQSLQLISIYYYAQIIKSYKARDIHKLKQSGALFIELMTDLDAVLATDEHFLLGRWLEDGKSLAVTETDRELFEYNARTQITTWGPRTEILDYGNKQWSGLINDYYKPRWQLFLTELTESLYRDVPYNQTKYKDDVYRLVEQAFTLDRNIYPTVPQGDAINVAKLLHQKYRPVTRKYSKFFKQLPKWSSKGHKWSNKTKYLKDGHRTINMSGLSYNMEA